MEQTNSSEGLSLPLDLKVERLGRGSILGQRNLRRIRHRTLTSLLETLAFELLSLNVLTNLLVQLLCVFGIILFLQGSLLFLTLFPCLV